MAEYAEPVIGRAFARTRWQAPPAITVEPSRWDEVRILHRISARRRNSAAHCAVCARTGGIHFAIPSYELSERSNWLEWLVHQRIALDLNLPIFDAGLCESSSQMHAVFQVEARPQKHSADRALIADTIPSLLAQYAPLALIGPIKFLLREDFLYRLLDVFGIVQPNFRGLFVICHANDGCVVWKCRDQFLRTVLNANSRPVRRRGRRRPIEEIQRADCR
jgi:hypothetical protein